MDKLYHEKGYYVLAKKNSWLLTRNYIKLLLIIGFLIICFSSQIHNTGFLYKIPITLLIALIYCGFLNLGHECLHQNFVNNRKINNLIGKIAFSFLIMNYSLYRDYHMTHHKYLNTDKDTESSPSINTIKDYLIVLSGYKFALKNIKKTFMAYFKKYPDYAKSRNYLLIYQDSVCVIVFLSVLCLITCYFPQELFFCYWLPAILAYPMVIFFGLPEHYQCAKIPSIYSEARTVKSNFLIRFFLWNANYHAEHHLYPSVPGPLLSNISKNCQEKIFYRENSYLIWHLKIIANLFRLKNTFK